MATSTPSTAILPSFGVLYRTQIVDKRRFIYLHKILNRETNHWTQKMLLHLKEQNTGWAQTIGKKQLQFGTKLGNHPEEIKR